MANELDRNRNEPQLVENLAVDLDPRVGCVVRADLPAFWKIVQDLPVPAVKSDSGCRSRFLRVCARTQPANALSRILAVRALDANTLE